MKKMLLRFLVSLNVILIICNPAYAQQAVIFKGSNAQMLPTGSLLTQPGQNIIYNGQVNYVKNQGAEGDGPGSAAAQWTRYADVAGTAPVDCTGGSPSITWTANTTTPLRNLQDFNFTKGASNRQGDGVATPFTLSGADTNKLLAISFDVKSTSANYTASDLRFYVYDVTNSTLITPPNNTIPAGFTGTMSTAFATTTSTSYRFCVHQASTNATAYNVYFDNFYVGPGSQVQGAAISAWQTYSPSYTNFGTGPATVLAYYRQNGSNMDLLVRFTAGTSPASAEARISLPGSYTTALSTSSLSVGKFERNVNTTNSFKQGVMLSNVGLNYLTFGRDDYTSGSPPPLSNLNADAFGSGETVAFFASVPIAEWAGSGTLNIGPGAQVEYAYPTGTVDADTNTNGSQVAYGPQGQTMSALTDTRNKYVVWQYPPQDGDLIFAQVSDDSGASWSDTTAPWVANSTSTLTQGVRYITTTAGVSRFQYGRYETLTSAWSSANRIRFVKVKPSAPVGFGMAGLDGSAGLVSAGKVPGLTTASSPGTGYIGEVLVASTAGSNALILNTTANVQSISLPAGNWLVYGHLTASVSGANSSTVIITSIEISANSGGFLDNESFNIVTYQGQSQSGQRIGTGPLYVSVNTTTTINMNVNINNLAGTAASSPSVASRVIRAIRQP